MKKLLFIIGLLCGGITILMAADGDVTISVSGMTTKMSDGTWSITINSAGRVSSLQRKGTEYLASNGIYFDYTTTNGNSGLNPSKVTVVKKTADHCEVLYSATSGNTIFEQGYIMRKGVPGLYTYVIATGTASSANEPVKEARVCSRLSELSKALFPLGNLKKPQVREIAAQLKLPTAQKKDSTGICFIGERPFREFLQKYLPTNKGEMKTPDGKIVGEHCGLSFYTIGQRKGLNIGGAGDAWFVAAKDMTKNELIVVQGHNHPLLLSDSLTMTDLSWTLPEKPLAGRYTAKTRYRMADAACELVYLSDNQAKLIFDTPQWAVTAGQSAVLYDGDICLGGGVIM